MKPISPTEVLFVFPPLTNMDRAGCVGSMRQRLDRFSRDDRSKPTNKDMTKSERKHRDDDENVAASTPQQHCHALPRLELEMESEHDADEGGHAILAKPSSPIRERTRAAHHNGSPTTTPPPSFSSLVSFQSTSTTSSSLSNPMKWTFVVLLGIALLLYSIPTKMPNSSTKILSRSSSPTTTSRGRLSPPKIRYDCPSSSRIPQNRDDAMHGKWYDQVSQQLLQKDNLTDYLQVYRQTEFDNWGLTYEQVKESMRDWKARTYAPVFTDPDKVYSIYESACGIGLNLALTTEILYETVPALGRLEVHGNDYVEASVTLAQRLYEQGRIVDEYKGRMGRFCAADSTRLEHVPSDSFDLVFTGYITPLTDPLHIGHQYDTPRDVERAYQAICENKTNPELVQQMQQAQEDFFEQWVAEMIRLARPGAPVIVEQVSLPLCEAYYDWGGVPREFWNASMAKWPVDADSLLFENDTIMRGRYHVFFRKN